jgi:asparagine synthase (glutamine-hydrolysing)
VLAEAPADLFDRRTVQRLLAGQRSGLSNAHRLFTLTLFELWRREYGITVPHDARDLQRVG